MSRRDDHHGAAPDASAGERAARRSRRTAWFLLAALWLILGALGVRLSKLQVARADRWRALAVRQQQPMRSVPAYRGDIRTADGAVLARSVRARSAFCEPRHMGRLDGRKLLPPTAEDLRGRAREIARALGWDAVREHALFERLSNPARQAFCWIQRRLGEHAAARLEAADIRGVGFKPEYRREYPCGPLAAHLIGFTRLDGDGEIRGATGIERAFDDALAGIPGMRETVRDGRGGQLMHEGHLIAPPEDGATVVLTIDSHMQRIAERAAARCAERWKPKGIAVVVLRPRDGRILAMGSWPAFDPSDLSTLQPEQGRNRALMDTVEPGSIMKPLVVAAALDAGAVSRHQSFQCPSPWRYRGRTIRDVHSHGTLDLAGVLVNSSNVGMAQVGLALGPEDLIGLLARCGFGAPTGLGLPLEERGKTTPAERWSYYSTTSVAMGYELAVTPIQAASAFAALAADGVRYRPQLVERVVDASGRAVRDFEPDPAALVATAATCREFIVPTLTRVVEEGTGKRARLDHWTVAGKTGTAKKHSAGGGYTARDYRTSFVAFAPATRPELLVGVVVDEPQSENGMTPYGGTVSAPVVREILEEALPYLRVAPDKAPPAEQPTDG